MCDQPHSSSPGRQPECAPPNEGSSDAGCRSWNRRVMLISPFTAVFSVLAAHVTAVAEDIRTSVRPCDDAAGIRERSTRDSPSVARAKLRRESRSKRGPAERGNDPERCGEWKRRVVHRHAEDSQAEREQRSADPDGDGHPPSPTRYPAAAAAAMRTSALIRECHNALRLSRGSGDPLGRITEPVVAATRSMTRARSSTRRTRTTGFGL